MSVSILKRRPELSAGQSHSNPRAGGGMARIGLFGEFGCGNVGNDASLDAMMQSVQHRYPLASLTCLCRDPESVTADRAIAAAPMSWSIAHPGSLGWLPGTLRKVFSKLLDIPYMFWALRELDAVVVPGTGIFEQFGIPPWGIPMTLLRLALLARVTRTHLAYVSVGVEPATSMTSKIFLRWALRLARYRSYRDAYSRDGAAGLGVDVSADRIFPDIAFGLGAGTDTSDAASDTDTSHSRPVLGVGVMGYFGPGFDADEREAANRLYLDKLVRALQALLDEGNDIRLLTADGADVASANRVLQALRISRPGSAANVTFVASGDIYALEREVSRCDLVIASRYHNVIAALRSNRPVVSLGYAPKNAALMNDLGLGSYCQDIADFDVDRLLEQVRDAGKQAATISSELRRSNIRYRAALNEQDELLNSQFFAAFSTVA